MTTAGMFAEPVKLGQLGNIHGSDHITIICQHYDLIQFHEWEAILLPPIVSTVRMCGFIQWHVQDLT